MDKLKFKCSKCKKKFDEIWQFGNYYPFKKYSDKDYCKECMDKIVKQMEGE